MLIVVISDMDLISILALSHQENRAKKFKANDV